jgi:lipopolysaccharide export system protein LptA
MKKGITYIVTLLLLNSVSLVTAAPDEHSTVRKDRSNLPITIKSNLLSADNKGKTAVFTGKVVAKQGDVTIFADKVIISYGDQKDEVDKVEADGNVRIIQMNTVGTALHAVFENREGRMTLTGNPRVMQGKDTLSGEIITYYVDEDRSVVTGGASVTIQPSARKGNETPR